MSMLTVTGQRLALVMSECRWAIIGRVAAGKWALPHHVTETCRIADNFLLYRDFSTSCRKFSNGTVDGEEIAKFDRAAQGWWNKVYGSENVALHTLNTLRVPFIRDALVQQKSTPSVDAQQTPVPLSGLTILDVGCGGGILSEPLARLGAKVTGLDASPELIHVASEHAKLDQQARPHLTYVCSSVEELQRQSSDRFDAVVASEIVEHVADVDSFVSSCCSLVKPRGSIFFTTMNKTWCSYVLSIVAAEQLFGIVPHGTHDWNKYISPQDLENILTRNNFAVRSVHGMSLNPLTLNWCWITNTGVNYALHAVRLPTDDENVKTSDSATVESKLN